MTDLKSATSNYSDVMQIIQSRCFQIQHQYLDAMSSFLVVNSYLIPYLP